MNGWSCNNYTWWIQCFHWSSHWCITANLILHLKMMNHTCSLSIVVCTWKLPNMFYLFKAHNTITTQIRKHIQSSAEFISFHQFKQTAAITEIFTSLLYNIFKILLETSRVPQLSTRCKASVQCFSSPSAG